MSEATKTPWHLWAVGILALLWNGFGAFDFTLSFLRVEAYLANFPQAMTDYLASMPGWTWAIWAIGTWGGVIGAVLLLLRNKIAAPVLAISLFGAVVSLAAYFVQPPPAETGANLVVAVVIVAIATALFAYAAWLSKRGVLR